MYTTYSVIAALDCNLNWVILRLSFSIQDHNKVDSVTDDLIRTIYHSQLTSITPTNVYTDPCIQIAYTVTVQQWTECVQTLVMHLTTGVII